jgi:hypothetical protein
MTDLITEQDRGAKAAAILREPLIQEAFAELRKSYVDGWSSSDPQDTDFREQCFHLLKALETFEGHFESVVTTGKMASQQMEALRN